jgi:phage shock protein E
VIEPFSERLIARARGIQRARADEDDRRLRVSKANLRPAEWLGETLAGAVLASVDLRDRAAMEPLEGVRAEELQVLLALAHAVENDGQWPVKLADKISTVNTVPAIDVKQLRDRLAANPPPFLLDVREPWEYREGHVPGAQLIPLAELEQRINEVPRDRPVLAICHSGQRSLAAAGFLLHLGYTSVSNVDGGTAAWIERGYPIDR